MAMLCLFHRSSMCRPGHCALMRSELLDLTTIISATACHQSNYVEPYSRYSGKAYISTEFEAVCSRLEIDHQTIISTQGESYMNLIETHFNIQRRLYDYQFALSTTPAALEQAHQAFIQLYNTTAHQGLLKEGFAPPIPVALLAEAKGRIFSPT